ncbi:MAG: hypothetical protein ABIG44_04800 [Planctomycetota bacterium]
MHPVRRDAGGDETTVATYEYWADNRHSEKAVSNSGVEESDNDGGNTTVRYYYGGVAAGLRTGRSGDVAARTPRGRWNILETRDGSAAGPRFPSRPQRSGIPILPRTRERIPTSVGARRDSRTRIATRQWVWGTQYVDELLFMDVNFEPVVDDDCDADVLTTLEQTGGFGVASLRAMSVDELVKLRDLID